MSGEEINEPLTYSSDECDEEGPWVFYRDRPEWKDIDPIELDEGPVPVVAIAYSDKFKDVFSYFRAVILRNEISERAFNLTSDAVELNPANYTVWQYRRTLLQGLGRELRDELKFVRRVIEEHPKNYQVWHHRRVLVELLQDPSTELRLTQIILAQDAKNYHAWQHRQWVLETFKLFDNELDYVEQLLEDDIRNNSAWNQRYFVVKQTTGFTEEVVNREISFAVKSLKSVSQNESAWNYLRGILEHYPAKLNGHPIVEEFCNHLESEGCEVSHFLAFLVDRIEERLQSDSSLAPDLLPVADKHLQRLASDIDPIRKQYWLFLSRNLNSQFSK